MGSLPRISREALGPILIASLLVLMAALLAPRPRPGIAPPSAVVGAPAAPERLVLPGVATPTPMAISGEYTPGGALDIVSAEGLFPAGEKDALAADLGRALAYVSQRFGSGPTGRISAYLVLEPGCGLHGIAYTAERMVQVYTCPDLPRARAVNIMAHEFVHQLAQDRYGDRHLQADLILLEGVATWGAGDYWLGGEPSFAAFVRPWVAAGNALPLATSYVGRPINDMNTLYYEWASFVEFLIKVYGRDRFDALYVSGHSDPGSADYLGVYGKSLDQLEAEWRDWVLSQ
ncbi:hypothetical protein K2Z83_03680 [Oscillochloris sp. ZM17-4]|uniref:hypothetical protein n=1 Tax=Oscillochloris sp. ZM17-4 TaxID=2866714 RepID=UPI001C73B53C|nr:hypothetical protein [Oscillochloris sp. ZM17-4]MBX0326781.1 hypothetical protein [Oscillochloris sp. ZM17-4]